MVILCHLLLRNGVSMHPANLLGIAAGAATRIGGERGRGRREIHGLPSYALLSHFLSLSCSLSLLLSFFASPFLFSLFLFFESFSLCLSFFLFPFSFSSGDRPGGGRGSRREPLADCSRAQRTANGKGLYIISS